MPAPGGVNANLFALLDDDDDDESGAPVQQKAPAKPAAEKPKEQTQKSEPRERKPKNDRKGGGKGRDNERTNEPYDGSDKPAKPSDQEGRGGKGRRKYDGQDGERKGKGKGSRRGRDYDRHSQTGRGKGETREGRGKFNWGEKTEGAPAEGTEASAVEAVAAEKATDEETPAPEPEEEENTMTFDEYMKAQSAKGPVGPVLNERKLDSKEKPDGFQATRDKGGKEDALAGMIFADYNGKKDEREEKHEREGWVVADDVLNIKFADPNKDSGKGGDRGDRRGKGKGKGGGKGDSVRGGRGAPRNSRPQQQGGKIELDDTNAFPSLA